jgi:hypothetical protein
VHVIFYRLSSALSAYAIIVIRCGFSHGIYSTIQLMTLGLLLGLEVGPEEGLIEEPVVKSEARKVGARLGPTLGILLGLEVGPEEGLEEPVSK